MYAAQVYQQYRTMQTQTADKGELVVMLYQGAIKFLARASAALQSNDRQEAHNNIVRCQDIIAELMASLDMGAGELAFNLLRLYEYMHHRLVEANLRKDVQLVDEVAGLLRELLPAWQDAARDARITATSVRDANVIRPGLIAG